MYYPEFSAGFVQKLHFVEIPNMNIACIYKLFFLEFGIAAGGWEYFGSTGC